MGASREKTRNRNGSSYNYESKNRERYQYQSRNSSSTHLQDKTNYRNYRNYQQAPASHYSAPVKDIYSVPQKHRERERGGTVRTSYSSASVPHRIIYDTPSPAIGSSSEPFTKFRTRIVINSES